MHEARGLRGQKSMPTGDVVELCTSLRLFSVASWVFSPSPPNWTLMFSHPQNIASVALNAKFRTLRALFLVFFFLGLTSLTFIWDCAFDKWHWGLGSQIIVLWFWTLSFNKKGNECRTSYREYCKWFVSHSCHLWSRLGEFTEDYYLETVVFLF